MKRNRNAVIPRAGGESIPVFSSGFKWIPRTSRGMTVLGICFLTTLLLAGCVDRGQADTKLARACEAGVEALLAEGEEVGEIVQTAFTNSPTGGNHRHVILTLPDDGWGSEKETYECIFEESFGFLNMNYTASVYQVRFDGRTVGKAGGKIMGDTQDMMTLTDAMRDVLYE